MKNKLYMRRFAQFGTIGTILKRGGVLLLVKYKWYQIPQKVLYSPKGKKDKRTQGSGEFNKCY